MSLLQKMFGKRQKHTHPYCAALIAAGENKLLQTLDGIPVLVRTLLTIDRVEGIDEIVIAAREDELLPYAELCKTFGLRKPVKVIVGGATRTESVLRAALARRHRRAHARSQRALRRADAAGLRRRPFEGGSPVRDCGRRDYYGRLLRCRADGQGSPLDRGQ